MNGEFTTLGEFATIQGGFAYKSSDFSGVGHFPVLKIKNVRFGNINYKETVFINEDLANATEGWSTEEGDILISLTGSGPNAPDSLVGRVARVWKNEPKAWINQRVGRVKLKGEKKIDSDFIFYLLSHKDSQEFLVNNSSGSANQANINGKTIESLPCPIISYEESIAVGNILRLLDEKIILNRQINQTLEAMAQALFKSWFVDFEPVRAKIAALEIGKNPTHAAMLVISGKTNAELDTMHQTAPTAYAQLETTANLFPNALIDSELGMVPEGWEVSTISEIGEVITGKTPSTQNSDYYGDDVPFITIPDMHNKLFVTRVGKKLSHEGANSQKNKYLPIGSVSVSCIATPGLVIYIHEVAQTNQQINTLLPVKEGHGYYWLYALKEISHSVISKGSGGSVFNNLNKGTFCKISVLSPPETAIDSFIGVCRFWLDTILSNQVQMQALATLRDTLLPKLLSGEISVPANQP